MDSRIHARTRSFKSFRPAGRAGVVVALAVLLVGTIAGAAQAGVARPIEPPEPKGPAVRPGPRPVQFETPLTSRPHHGLPAGQQPPIEPPRLAVAAPASGHAAGSSRRPFDGGGPGTGPQATNVMLLPGLAIGDTSLVAYFDAPDTGWVQGTVSLFADADHTTVLHEATFPVESARICGSPAKYCWTLTNAEGWGVLEGTPYAVTVTLGAADGSQRVSAFSAAVAPRTLPVPPPLPAEQVSGSDSAQASAATAAARPVLRGFAVNAATGAFTQQATDASMSSAYQVNVSFGRAYSSADAEVGPLGIGWHASYDVRVAPKAGDPQAVVVVAENGARSTYTRRPDGSYATPPAARATLTARPDGGWDLVNPDQRRLSFGADGRLRSIVDHTGKGVTISYNGAGIPTTVTDAGGRVLVVKSSAGRITQLVLPDRRTVTYSYTGNRLTAVRDADGAVTKYTYDAAGRLVCVVDALGHKQVTNAYDPVTGRVASQTDVYGKVTRLAWYADVQESVVTDPDGVEIRDGFRDNVPLYSRNGNGDTTINRFDQRLNLAVVADPLGHQVQTGHDDRGNPTARSLFGGDAVNESATYDNRDQVLTETDGRGKTWSYVYTATGQPDTATDPEGHTTKQGYDPVTGLLTTLTDGLGNVTRYGYDAAGNRTSVTDATGATTTSTYDATGRLTCQTDPRGNAAGADRSAFTTTYDVYDGRDRLLRMTDPLRHTRLWNYDAVGNLRTETDANGSPTTYVYDNANRLTTMIDADLRTTRHAYTAAGRERSVTDGAGGVTSTEYDSAGRISKRISARGNQPGVDRAQFTTTYKYDWNGNLTSIEHPYPGGGTFSMRTEYTPLNQPLTQSDALGTSIRYGYDKAGNRTSLTDSAGNGQTWEYDGTDRVTAEQTRRHTVTRSSYDAAGRLASETAPDGGVTTYGYDAAGRLTSVTSPRGNASGADPTAFTTHYGYDLAGNQTSVTDPLGDLRRTEYDAADRVVRQTDPNNHTTRYTYDNANRLVRILGPDARNDTQATVNNYDHVGHLIDRTDPLGRVTRQSFDGAGRVSLSVDGVGNRRQFVYDADGNLVKLITGRGSAAGDRATRDANTIVSTYDILGRLTERVLGGATRYAFGYDGANRLTSQVDPTGEQTRTYDELGRLATVSRGGATFTYRYDESGHVIGRTLPDGGTETTTYDPLGRPATVTTALGETRYGYDLDSDLTSVTLPGGQVDTRTYDAARRLATLSSRVPAGPVADYTVSHDGAGNPVQVATTVGGVTRSDAFQYDRADRLTAECPAVTSCASTGNRLSFQYDLVGNRTARSRSGPGAFTERYTYNAADQLVSRSGGPDGTVTYDFDADGNQTRAGAVRVRYDLENHPVLVDNGRQQIGYRYDADGNRLSAAVSGGPAGTSYTWDVNRQLPALVSERPAAGPVRGYTYHPDGTPMAQRVGDVASFIRADPFGNTVALTSSDGQVQRRYTLSDPFGGLTAGGGDVDTRIGFQGQYQDPDSAEYDLRARDYDTGTGRFLGVDPDRGSVGQPAVSTYVYAYDNPLTGTDPSGRSCLWLGRLLGLCEEAKTLWVDPNAKHVGDPVMRTIPTGVKYPTCLPDCDELGLRNWQTYINYIVMTSANIGIDPRMLASTFKIETRTCFEQPLEVCMSEWKRQVDGWFDWIDDDPSIGYGNMTRSVFDDVVAKHASDLQAKYGEPKFEDLIVNPALAFDTTGYREADLQQSLTVQKGTGLYYSREELVDFGYRGTEEAMKSVAAGDESMSEHGLTHLGLFRDNWKEADELICHSGYWTCWWE